MAERNVVAAQSAVHLDDLCKTYERDGQRISVLENISLSIPQGEFLALMGPSGSGKTTLLNLIAGIDHPTSGSVQVYGINVSALSEGALATWRSRCLGFIFQFYNLIPVLTAAANVELPLIYAGIPAEERTSRAKASLTAVGMESRMNHKPNELSGGQRQRVAIARALVNKPSIILADEPTGNLDSQTGIEIMALFDRLHAEGNTIVLVTHEHDIAAYAHRVMPGVCISALTIRHPSTVAMLQRLRSTRPIARPDPLTLPVTQLQHLRRLTQSQAARLYPTHHFHPAQLFLAQSRSPQSRPSSPEEL